MPIAIYQSVQQQDLERYCSRTFLARSSKVSTLSGSLHSALTQSFDTFSFLRIV